MIGLTLVETTPIVVALVALAGLIWSEAIRRRTVTETAEREHTARQEEIDRAEVLAKAESRVAQALAEVAAEEKRKVDDAQRLVADMQGRMAFIDQLQESWQHESTQRLLLEDRVSRCQEREAELRVQVAECKEDSISLKAEAERRINDLTEKLETAIVRIAALETRLKEKP